MPMKRYDVIVIGTGAAASAVAPPCRKAGRAGAIIDSRPFGGTCAVRGFDPKKVPRRRGRSDPLGPSLDRPRHSAWWGAN